MLAELVAPESLPTANSTANSPQIRKRKPPRTAFGSPGGPNPRIAALLSVAARRSKALQPPAPPLPDVPIPPQTTYPHVPARLKLLNEQILSLQQVLSGKLEPRDRAQLLNSLDRLLERERVLSGQAAPAPSRGRAAPTYYQVSAAPAPRVPAAEPELQPTEPEPEPTPPAPAPAPATDPEPEPPA